MAMNPYLSQLVASGRFFTDGTTNGVGYFARGCSVSRSAAGTYAIVTDRALANDQCVVLMNAETADRNAKVVSVTPGTRTIAVKTRSTAVPGDADSVVNFAVFQVAGGGGATGL